LFVQIYFVATCFLKTEKSSLELLAKDGYKISANDHGLLPAVEFKDFPAEPTTNLFLFSGEASMTVEISYH
jgi:hypothetical protein